MWTFNVRDASSPLRTDVLFELWSGHPMYQNNRSNYLLSPAGSRDARIFSKSRSWSFKIFISFKLMLRKVIREILNISREIHGFFQANPVQTKSRDPSNWQDLVLEIPGLKFLNPAGAWIPIVRMRKINSLRLNYHQQLMACKAQRLDKLLLTLSPELDKGGCNGCSICQGPICLESRIVNLYWM